MKQLQTRFVLIVTLLAVAVLKVTGQVTMPETLIKSSMQEQLKFIEEKTRIYENYRAIREDMFQKIKGNVSDTLSSANNMIASLNKTTSLLKHTIDSLRSEIETTQKSLTEMTTTKNSIRIMGFEVNKSAYNSVMWTILAGLVAVLLIGFLVFKRNLSAIFNTKKEFQELKNEFEAYRKTSREAREKLTMDHFKEIQKLKGG